MRAACLAVLPHRVVPNYRATGEGLTAYDIVAQVLAAVREPKY